VEVSLKNISERQMNIKAADLTERFIRGDDSRTTEGSGLGLYITKNLVQAQHGEFDIRLDGDLFKAVLRFPEYVEKSVEELDMTETDMK
jgi:signal transduction histidine kinase